MSEWVLEVSEVNEYVRQLLQNEPALRKVRSVSYTHLTLPTTERV